MNIFLTGATGFVGKNLFKVLTTTNNFNLSVAVRRKFNSSAAKIFELHEIDANTVWGNVLDNQEVVSIQP